MMQRISAQYGRFLAGLALAGCAVLLLMMLVICVDVLLRNVHLVPGLLGVPWANEVTEYALYLITMLTAPWLLRQGQHIRVDILLRALPLRLAWALEWAGDVVGLFCSLYFVWYGVLITKASYTAGSINIKTLVTPEWWTLIPLPLAFSLVALEFFFRMHRLASAEIGLRDDAISAA